MLQAVTNAIVLFLVFSIAKPPHSVSAEQILRFHDVLFTSRLYSLQIKKPAEISFVWTMHYLLNDKVFDVSTGIKRRTSDI
ncbi:MAG: hypothetical protein IJU39_02175 [Clostridia bacterium]|nr:hypothetical protein [Clostridia bacterium]